MLAVPFGFFEGEETLELETPLLSAQEGDDSFEQSALCFCSMFSFR